MNNVNHALESAGLTDAEVQLYVALLQLQEARASKLVDVTGKNRSFIYDILNKLTDRGLVSYTVKEGKRFFRPSHPSQLLTLIQEKEQQLKEVLPELERLSSTKLNNTNVEVFKSKKGICSVLDLALKEKEEVFIYGSIKLFRETLPKYFESWNKKRGKLDIHAKILAPKMTVVPFSESDCLSEEEDFVATTFTFSRFVVHVLWSDDPVAVLTESEDIAREHKVFFQNLWTREVKVYYGSAGIQHAWMQLVKGSTSEVVGFGISRDLVSIYHKEFSGIWHSQREKNNIPVRFISYDDDASIELFSSRAETQWALSMRFLSRDISGPTCVAISDNLIITFLYNEEKPQAVISKNELMIETYREHFERLWEKSSLSVKLESGEVYVLQGDKPVEE